LLAVIVLVCALAYTAASQSSDEPGAGGHVLSGRVLDRRGRPLVPVSIQVTAAGVEPAVVRSMFDGVGKHLSMAPDSPVRFIEAGPRGMFEVRDLDAGAYALTVIGSEGPLALEGGSKEGTVVVALPSDETTTKVTLRALPGAGAVPKSPSVDASSVEGEARVADVTAPSWASLRGHVVAHGHPLAGVLVTLASAPQPEHRCRSTSGPTEAPQRTTTDAHGAFAFERADPCTARVFVGPEGAPWSVRTRWSDREEAFGLRRSWPVVLVAGKMQDLVLEVRPQGATP
jgi:hypothetical protein